MGLFIVESRYKGFSFHPRLAFPGIAGAWCSQGAAEKAATEMRSDLDHYCPGVGRAAEYRVVEYMPLRECARTRQKIDELIEDFHCVVWEACDE